MLAKRVTEKLSDDSKAYNIDLHEGGAYLTTFHCRNEKGREELMRALSKLTVDVIDEAEA